jgi:LPXTG-site transpeptidase (sortase) family protein
MDESNNTIHPIFKVFVAILYLSLLFYFVHKKPHPIQHPKIDKGILRAEIQQKKSELPVRLVIPAINVSAHIQHVGITTWGQMETPNNSTDVGWFKLGSRPGENGSSVIAGHFDGKNGENGVFSNLNKLKKGDIVYVKDDKGTATTFMVRESRTYNSGYADEVFSTNNSAYLNLITCDGVWDGDTKSYSKRLVVFTDIVR